MDFHNLSRKDLQKLCKKNKIPANTTNVAMADALGALQQVEGLDEFLDPLESDNTERLPDEKVVGTPQIHRTACRTATRRKPVREEPESFDVSTRLRRGTRAGNAEGNDQENKDLNVPATPPMPSRTRAPAISTRRKKETHMKEDEKINVPKTPAAPPSARIRSAGRSVTSKLETTGGTAIQRTRRSVRLLEKSLAGMSLVDTESTEHVKNDEIAQEITNVSQQNQDSARSEMAVDSENSDNVEATSQEKDNGDECQPQESQSEVQLNSEAGASLQDSFLEVNCNYYSEHASIPELEVCSEIYNDSSEALECRDESNVDFRDSIEKEVKLNDESVDGADGVLLEVENSIDFSNPENKFCSDAMQDVPVGTTDNASADVSEQKIAGSLAVSSLNIDSVCPEELVENSCSDAMQDFHAEATDDASPDVTEQEIAGSLSVSSPNIDSLSPEFKTDNQGEENEHWNVVDGDEMLHPDGSPAKVEVRMDPLLVDSEKMEANGEKHENSDSLSDSGESKEGMEKIFVVSENSVADFQLGDIEVKMEHPVLNSENLEARREPETSVCPEELVENSSSDAMQDFHIGATDDASPDVTEQETAGSLSVSSPNIDSVSPEFKTDIQDEENEHWNLVHGDEMLHPDGSPAKLEVRMDPLLVDSEKMEANGEKHENSDSLSDSGESKEVMEKIFVVSENSVADLQPGDIEVKMEHPMLNSENLEARGEPETSVLLCDLEDSKVYSENSVADLKPGDIEEIKMDSLKDDSVNFQAERAFVEESGALFKSDVIPEEIVVSTLEFHLPTHENEYEIMKHSSNSSREDSFSSVDEVLPTTLSSNCEHKTGDVPIQSISVNKPKDLFPCLAQSELDETVTANEVQTAQNACTREEDKRKILKMKENLSTDALNGKTIGELKRMFKMLSLDGKANRKSNNGAKPEVEWKRTALQALPANRMAVGEAESDA